jgi:hypothetical protein
VAMTSWTCERPEPSAELPARELSDVLDSLMHGLVRLRGADHGSVSGSTASGVDALYAYLVHDLTPVLHAMHVRIRPVLRRREGTGRDSQAAEEYAALLRLAEQVALLRAEYQQAGGDRRYRTDLSAVMQQVSVVAGRHLGAARRTLPVFLRRLPAGDAQSIIGDARRTARAAAQAPRRDLQPAGL